MDLEQARTHLSTLTTSIQSFIRDWSLHHAREDAPVKYDRMVLGDLSQAVADWYRGTLGRMVEIAKDRALNPERPCLLLSDPKNYTIPTVWLLLWRGEEETEIHDHGLSSAGIHIFKGDITEILYHTPSDYMIQPNGFLIQKHERDMREGSTIQIPSPYIHLFRGAKDQACSVSIHSYWPPLTSMSYFVEDDDLLQKSGGWEASE